MKKYITGLLLLAFAVLSWAEPTRLVCAGSYVSSSTSQELNVHTRQFDSVGHSETINLRYDQIPLSSLGQTQSSFSVYRLLSLQSLQFCLRTRSIRIDEF